MIHKTPFFAAMALALTGLFGGTSLAYAQTTSTTGTVESVHGDPGQYFVIALSQAGRCGSKFFHIDRSTANYKDMVAISLTAFSANKRMTVYVTSCSGERNIISHGGAYR